jgi:hypothetical protein
VNCIYNGWLKARELVCSKCKLVDHLLLIVCDYLFNVVILHSFCGFSVCGFHWCLVCFKKLTVCYVL